MRRLRLPRFVASPSVDPAVSLGLSTFQRVGITALAIAANVQPAQAVVAPPTLDYGTPAQATRDVAYSLTPTFTGSGVTFAITAGSLPAGLALDPTTGEISGTPTAAGDSTITVTATNAGGSASQTITISVVFDPTPSGYTEHGTFRFANNYSSSDTSGDITGKTAQPAVGHYAYNPDTGEYIRFTFVSGDIVSYSRAQLGSSAAAISSSTTWTDYRPV